MLRYRRLPNVEITGFATLHVFARSAPQSRPRSSARFFMLSYYYPVSELDRTQTEQYIAEGYRDTLSHNCRKEGCVLARG